MGFFSNLFGNERKGFGEAYLSQIRHMNGQRTVVSIQIASSEGFPTVMNRSKDSRTMINGEIRNERLFFGLLNVSYNEIVLMNSVNQFEDVEGFDKGFEIKVTIEKSGNEWSQFMSYKDLKSGQTYKFRIKGHVVYTI